MGRSIELEDVAYYVFSRHYDFSSSNSAASVIHCGSVNGFIVWKTIDGTTLLRANFIVKKYSYG